MDPKKILGVDEDSSPAEIRIAYRRLARKHHPDIGGNAVDFKQVREAYEILTGKRKSRAAKASSSITAWAAFRPSSYSLKRES